MEYIWASAFIERCIWHRCRSSMCAEHYSSPNVVDSTFELGRVPSKTNKFGILNYDRIQICDGAKCGVRRSLGAATEDATFTNGIGSVRLGEWVGERASVHTHFQVQVLSSVPFASCHHRSAVDIHKRRRVCDCARRIAFAAIDFGQNWENAILAAHGRLCLYRRQIYLHKICDIVKWHRHRIA